MRYVCSICGYIYDEKREDIPFSQLSDAWTCPLCGAAKSLFVPEQKVEAPKMSTAPVLMDEDMTQLSVGALAALCSNLARGCEKQYKDEEAALFREIADYFTAAMLEVPDASVGLLEELLKRDLEQGYPAVSGAAKAEGDRGTQRICVWGEKVTNILHSLVERYQREGEAFLRGKQIWVCSVCGFVYVGDKPPVICPVCKVPDWKFDKL